MVDNETSQLKSDLDQLLNFNWNLLHFDGSIVTNAAKNKVEKFMKNLSTTIATQIGDKTNDLEKLEAASNILRYLIQWMVIQSLITIDNIAQMSDCHMFQCYQGYQQSAGLNTGARWQDCGHWWRHDNVGHQK